MSRRYISITEAAEYLGISTKFVRNLIMEGEIKGYRIGSYARHRTLRVDLDEIDEKLTQPVGPYWNDPSAKPTSAPTTTPCRIARPPSAESTPSTRLTNASAPVVTGQPVITRPTALGHARHRPG
jgi:excisionase family DNA binding protein